MKPPSAGLKEAPSLARRRIDQCSGRNRYDHSGDTTDCHNGADWTDAPAARLQEDAEERTDAGLGIGHEEIECLHRVARPTGFLRSRAVYVVRAHLSVALAVAGALRAALAAAKLRLALPRDLAAVQSRAYRRVQDWGSPAAARHRFRRS